MFLQVSAGTVQKEHEFERPLSPITTSVDTLGKDIRYNQFYNQVQFSESSELLKQVLD